MAGAVHDSGPSSFKDGCGGWRTSDNSRGLCAAGSAGAAGALGVEERPGSLRGVSSMPWAWSFSRARARSSEVAFKARRAEPSAAALVVLLGTAVPWDVWRASAIASRSRRLSRISCNRWVVKTDSAMLHVGMRPQYFPWLRVLAV